MKLIAITGGIGTGKSVVSHILMVMGYPVYDCDSEAKRLMVKSSQLVTGIVDLLGPESYCADGNLNKAYVASRIFADKTLVEKMNMLVHPAVLADIQRWATSTGKELCFVETALLRESNMTSIIDEVWTVVAPLELRIQRVASRSNLSPDETRARMSNQSNDSIENAVILTNDGSTPLLPQILALLK